MPCTQYGVPCVHGTPYPRVATALLTVAVFSLISCTETRTLVNVESKPITLRDIAQAAGCSHTTVSLALRNHYRIPAATRTAIRQLADKMGYQANPYVKTLLSQVRRGKLPAERAGLALVSNYARKEQWRQMPNNNQAVRAAFQRAQELGYTLEEFSLRHGGMTFARLRKILLARGILGILVAPTADERLELAMDVSPFAVVSMGQSLRNRNISMVSHYHAHSMRELLQRLGQLGYRRIACTVESGIDQRIENAWSAHFCQYQSGVAQRNRIPLLLRKPGIQPADILGFLRRHKPDAFVSDDENHLRLLRAAGGRVPETIGFATLCVLPGTRDLSGIRQNNQFTGIRAIELLVQLINNGVFGIPESAQYVYIPGEWNDGTTLRSAVI